MPDCSNVAADVVAEPVAAPHLSWWQPGESTEQAAVGSVSLWGTDEDEKLIRPTGSERLSVRFEPHE